MPVLKSKFEFRKLYRGRECRFAADRGSIMSDAIGNAEDKFFREFGYVPCREHVVVEVIGVSGGWDATYLEVK